MYPIEPSLHKNPATYAVFENVISLDACKQIIALSKEYKKEVGSTSSTKDKRVSDIWWLHYEPGFKELYDKLASTVKTANETFWDFHLTGFLEPLQLTHYTHVKRGHYDWHMDKSDVGTMQCRKISGSLVLNEGYKGGQLELFDAKPTPPLKPGSLVLFPGYHLHRVTPLTAGERWSLVFWVTGPRWL